ncbi:hypothetical protein Tco_0270312 [Tanacetum coccineum]
MQHLPPNNNSIPQPSFNQDYMQQPVPYLEDISDPTTAMNTTLVIPKAVQNSGIQNVGNQPRLLVVPGIANPNAIQNGNGNVVAARAKANGNGNNGNQIKCYNCRGLGHLAKNYTVRPRRRDASYLQTQLLIAQKEEAGMQLQAEEFDLMAAAGDIDDIEKVNANCILMANLQQASTSGIQIGQSPVYDSDGTYEVHVSLNYHDNDIFNMFTQEERYTEVLEPISEPHHIQQNNSNVTSVDSSMEQSGGTVQQHFATIEETRAHYESLFTNLAVEVKKVNMVNHKLKEANSNLTIELARYKGQEKSFEINKAKFNELETGYGKSVYREQCLDKKINAIHLSSEEKKRLKSDFKIREDELLDKLIQYDKKIKELDNILVKTGQSIQTMRMLTPKPDSFYRTKQKMALGMFRIDSSQTSRVEKVMPHKPRASFRTTPITASQSHVTSQENVNPNLNGLSSIGNAKSEVVCAMCKQCLITANHDVCVLNYVNDMNSRSKKQKANVSNLANQTKQMPKAKNSKNLS